MEEFEGLAPESVDFEVGYFSGKQSKKNWLLEDDDDIVQMYEKLNKHSILLWCDRKQSVSADPPASQANSSNRKRSSSSSQSYPIEETFPLFSKRLELETEVDDIVTTLQETHGNKFTTPQLRMWARYVQAGHYKDLQEPPPLPAFKGIPFKGQHFPLF